MRDLINEIHPFPEKNSLSLPPGDWESTCGLNKQAIGFIAQAYFNHDFLQRTQIPRSECYFDDTYAGPVDHKLVNFIIRNNPLLGNNVKSILKSNFGKRPDILVHSPYVYEFYEIKPYSFFGIVNGNKIEEINTNFRRFGLPYKRGFFYKPSTIIRIGAISRGGHIYDFSFITSFISPGLLTYKLCVATNKNNNITFTKDRNVGQYFKEFISLHI